MPNLDMRSAYLLNGIKFEIHDLALTPTKVQSITDVSTEEYDHFLAGEADRLVYEDAFDRMGCLLLSTGGQSARLILNGGKLMGWVLVLVARYLE